MAEILVSVPHHAVRPILHLFCCPPKSLTNKLTLGKQVALTGDVRLLIEIYIGECPENLRKGQFKAWLVDLKSNKPSVLLQKHACLSSCKLSCTRVYDQFLEMTEILHHVFSCKTNSSALATTSHASCSVFINSLKRFSAGMLSRLASALLRHGCDA